MLPRQPAYRTMPTGRHHYYSITPGYYRQSHAHIAPPIYHNASRRQGPMQRKQGGGLLAKLLHRGGNGQSASRSAMPYSGLGAQNATRGGSSILQTLTNPSSINGFLTNTQKVLNTAQQIGPLVQQIQQYGPLVKNLPAMWRLYKGLKNVPNNEETKKDPPLASDDPPPPDNTAPAAQAAQPETTEAETKKEQSSAKTDFSGRSIPKMYI